MQPGNLDSSDRLSRAGRNDDESRLERFQTARPLPVENPIRRSLCAEHFHLEVSIPCEGECAPDNEGAPEIEQ